MERSLRGADAFFGSCFTRRTRAERSESSPDGKLCIVDFLAREQALRGALAAGREKEGELATTSPEFEFRLQFLCSSP